MDAIKNLGVSLAVKKAMQGHIKNPGTNKEIILPSKVTGQRMEYGNIIQIKTLSAGVSATHLNEILNRFCAMYRMSISLSRNCKRRPTVLLLTPKLYRLTTPPRISFG